MPSVGRDGRSEICLIQVDSLSATLETRRKCVSFKVTVWLSLWR